MAAGHSPAIVSTTSQGVGRVTLNRPERINALDHPMVLDLLQVLDDWSADDQVDVVLVDGAGHRGLCAGGDIRRVHQDAVAGGTASLSFWHDEYKLNLRISQYPKPVMAIMEGLVLGGGVGIACHAGLRVVTESSKVGLPQVGIGFIPDVGATYLLSRAGNLGLHIGLTGDALGPADAIAAGLADIYVPADELNRVLAQADSSTVAAELRSAAADPGPARVAEAPFLDCYAAGDIEQILALLRALGDPLAQRAADRIESASPTAVRVALEAIRRGAGLGTLHQALEFDYQLAHSALKSHDLPEGIRAKVIDKDNSPRWCPATLSLVADDTVNDFFTEYAHVRLRF